MNTNRAALEEFRELLYYLFHIHINLFVARIAEETQRLQSG